MRWGVVGHGRIVTKFLDAARGVGHEGVAVVGRDPSRVAAFAASHGISQAGIDPSGLVDEVDAVYVATPHSGHRDAALALLPSGVPVLCEKPMAANATQVRQMLDAARGSGAFLMEAMWTRHLPVLRRLREWIDQGRLGEIRTVEAAFGFDAPYQPTNRLWSSELAGGSLLDLGIYPLTLAELVFDCMPVSFEAEAELSASGVDSYLSLKAEFAGGGSAYLRSALNADLSPTARIVGSAGVVESLEFWRAERMVFDPVDGGRAEEVLEPHGINGFEYQILEAARCLEAGRSESAMVPWTWSLAMAELTDKIRARIGVVYPSDGELQ